jgi:polysaccharide chain length determinant protein (PEP-CTERM system associated)
VSNSVVEEFLGQVKHVARVVSKRRWLALGAAAAAAVGSGVAIATLSDRYEAKARVYVDTQTVLKPMMAGLTFQPDVDQQVRMLANTLISRPNVERLVSTPALQIDVSEISARERLITGLMAQIKVAPSGAGNLYEISYRGDSPERALRLVDATVQMFVSAGAGDKKRDSEDAGRFIDDQVRNYEAKLVEAENRLKDFKIRNFGVSGVSNQDYYARVSLLTDEVNKLRVELSAAEQSRDAFRRELAQEDPQLPAELAPKTGSAAVLEVEGRLEAQKKVLDDLVRRFTDEHPDVVSARRVITQLEAEARSRREAEERALAKLGKTGKAATSPVYQKLRISLAEAEAQVASLRSQLATQQGRLDQVRSSAGRLPQVEAELAQLNRDYDIIRKNYDAMVSRREAAALGVKVDASAQLAEFRVVEPPRVSPSPVFPSRLHLALIAVVASLAVGIGVAVLADSMRPTFDDAKSLEQLSGRPVLGAVSMLVTPQGQVDKRTRLVRFGAALCVLLVLQAVWVGWIAMNPRIL